MIFPWLRGFLLPRYAPVTWALFFFNLLVYMLFSLQSVEMDISYDEYFNDNENLKVQGFVFAHFVERNPASYSDFHQQLSQRAMAGHERALNVLSSLATRDVSFKRSLASLETTGDQIAFDKWKKAFEKFQTIQDRHPGYLYGLSQSDPSFFKMISYQFVHSGYFHLLFNMILLLIFGCFLESAIGSLFTAILYVVTGIAAAQAFILLTGLSSAPLVGASGAVSGLIGFFSLVFWHRRVTFFYWLLPKRGYFGFANLPAWLFFVLWTSGELASQIAEIPEAGGIAHSAHLGGVSAGMLMGVFFLVWRKTTAKSVF